MTLQFGTSGVRGLAVDFTPAECRSYAFGFLRHFMNRAELKSDSRECFVAGDFRASTPEIMRGVAEGVRDAGFEPVSLGFVPTPALAYACQLQKTPGIMVTGSHIPGDRNGLKFYFPWGEVLKEDESPILREKKLWFERSELQGTGFSGAEPRFWDAKSAFIRRYRDFFGPDALRGVKVVFYEHSTLGREVTPEILEAVGAEVIRVARSEEFVPVDTEALGELPALSSWLAEHQPFAVVSADGDADRPLLLDEKGRLVRGDQLGILVTQELGAAAVVTPVSSNTALELSGLVGHVRRTKIGSPYVIEGMLDLASAGSNSIVGYEANGGFLVGSLIQSSEGGRMLSPLPTRDSVLPVVAVLVAAHRRGVSLSSWVESLPSRYTESGLIKGFALERSSEVLRSLRQVSADQLNQMFGDFMGALDSLDETDGFRMTFVNGDILHFRPSGNAPEFRVYSEAGDSIRAAEIVKLGIAWVTSRF